MLTNTLVERLAHALAGVTGNAEEAAKVPHLESQVEPLPCLDYFCASRARHPAPSSPVPRTPLAVALYLSFFLFPDLRIQITSLLEEVQSLSDRNKTLQVPHLSTAAALPCPLWPSQVSPNLHGIQHLLTPILALPCPIPCCHGHGVDF